MRRKLHLELRRCRRLDYRAQAAAAGGCDESISWKEFAMSKWMSVAALAIAFVVCGCHHDKDDDMSSAPKKMSVDKSGKSCSTCDKAK